MSYLPVCGQFTRFFFIIRALQETIGKIVRRMSNRVNTIIRFIAKYYNNVYNVDGDGLSSANILKWRFLKLKNLNKQMSIY